jgi:MMPL family/2'-5' RNA ligase superfamily
LIGLQSTLPIPAYVPMLVFCIVFGLSMDYEVFLLSRVHEAWRATGDAHRSVAIGIGATARVITTAALIMIVVFASFVINPDPTVKMLAIGMAFAVLIDASLVRMILVPAIMSLLGAHAWWLPRWLARVVPSLRLEGDAALPGPRSRDGGQRRERTLGGVRNHWWWRPGWRPGRRMYAWHVTFGGQPAVKYLAARARDLLRDVPGLDLVPEPWLHLTTQDVGFSDEVSAGDLAAITAAARSRLAAVPPGDVTIGPARVVDEGIGCDAHPAAALSPIRDAVRAAIGDVRGAARVPGEAGWWPHVSLAYASADGPSAPAKAALAGFTAAAAVTVTEVQLILLGRDEHVYQWEPQATVSLGAPG